MMPLLTHLAQAFPQPGKPRPRLFALRPKEGEAPLAIGLLNNMPDAALASTERQFRALLAEAGISRSVELTVFALRDKPRSDAGRRYVREQTAGPDAIWTARLDALIVTGTDPVAARLNEEPYWPEMARLVDWAEANTVSTLWSGLAAHAAVLHLDGIEHQRLGRKLLGVFEGSAAWRGGFDSRKDDAVVDRRSACRDNDFAGGLLAHMPRRWPMPHSRVHDLPKAILTDAGYTVVTVSDDAGVDLFARQGRSLFVFMQGHPEYDAQTLLRQYRRDVARFYLSESEYPEMPRNYFDPVAERLVGSVQSRALRDRRIDPLPLLAEATYGAVLRHRWQAAAVTLFANWLATVAARRAATPAFHTAAVA